MMISRTPPNISFAGGVTDTITGWVNCDLEQGPGVDMAFDAPQPQSRSKTIRCTLTKETNPKLKREGVT